MQCRGRDFLSWGVLIVIQWNLLFMILLSSRLDSDRPRKTTNVRRPYDDYSSMKQKDLGIENQPFVLPKRLIAVFGTENSGSTVTATALGVATGAFHPMLKDKHLLFRSMDPTGTVEVQHISLPMGWGAGDTWTPYPAWHELHPFASC
jgi:hypothetical protein